MTLASLDPLARALPVPLAIVDRHGRVVGANRRLEELAGRPVGELVGVLLLGELIETSADAEARLRRALDSGSVELRLRGSFRGTSSDTRSSTVLLRSFTHDGELRVLAWLDDGPAETSGGDGDAELQEALRQVAKARHNLNNLLMGLLGHAEFLREMDQLPEDARARAEAVMQQVGRLRDAVQRLGAIYKR